jgi:hypothetical protein
MGEALQQRPGQGPNRYTAFVHGSGPRERSTQPAMGATLAGATATP